MKKLRWMSFALALCSGASCGDFPSLSSDPYYGLDVRDAGDVDRDGKTDLLVALTSYVPKVGWRGGSRTSVGCYSIGDGHRVASLLDSTEASSTCFAACSLGDLDRDGVADYALGEQFSLYGEGRVSIRSGVDGAELSAHRLFRSERHSGTECSRFGLSLSTCADIDGDGLPELIVGAPGYKRELEGSGLVAIFSSKTGSPLMWRSGHKDSYLGMQVLGTSDMDGDGKPDVLAQANMSSSGFVDVPEIWLLSSTGSTIRTHRGLGAAVMDDLDGDGIREYVFCSIPGQAKARVVMVSGRTGEILYEVSVPEDAVSHPSLHDFFNQPGHALTIAVVGDMDGDGISDLAVTPHSRSMGTSASGLVFYWERAPIVFLSGRTGSLLVVPELQNMTADRVQRIHDVDGDGIDDMATARILPEERGAIVDIVSCGTKRVLSTMRVPPTPNAGK